MKKTRSLPYGYSVQNGKTTINENEAQIVQRIFNEYTNGSSLNEIASNLVRKNIAYLDKQISWNKAKIARIIDNAKYIGEDNFDPIINKPLFELAIELKENRRTKQLRKHEHFPNIFDNLIYCAHCKSKIIHKKSDTTEYCSCSNPECKNIFHIPLSELTNNIINQLNITLINQQSQIKNENKTSTEIIRLERELQMEYTKETINEDHIFDLIQRISSSRYDTEKRNIYNNSNLEKLSSMIHAIYIEANSNIKIEFKK